MLYAFLATIGGERREKRRTWGGRGRFRCVMSCRRKFGKSRWATPGSFARAGPPGGVFLVLVATPPRRVLWPTVIIIVPRCSVVPRCPVSWLLFVPVWSLQSCVLCPAEIRTLCSVQLLPSLAMQSLVQNVCAGRLPPRPVRSFQVKHKPGHLCHNRSRQA